MPNSGLIVARVYTSAAMLPIQGAAVYFSSGRQPLAFRLTDQDGYTSPVSVETPDDTGIAPSDTQVPYTAVTITVEHPGYDRIVVENAQIFTNTKTVQELMLVPSSAANGGRRTQTFHIPNQNL